MGDHRKFVAGLKKKKGKNATLTEDEKLNNCNGSYVVRCEELSDDWDNCDSLSIDISTGPKPGILQAAVEFGIIEGTMLLAFNAPGLDAYVGMRSDQEDNDSEDYDENDVEDSEDGYLNSASTSKKRKALIKAAASKRGRGRPKKQVKTNTTSSNCLLFRLQGCETSERWCSTLRKKDISNSQTAIL
jgi:hypothetical protein